MKLLMAYIRPNMAQAVVAALLEAGCRDILVQDVKRLVPGLRGEDYAFSVELGQRYEAMTALTCPADDDAATRWTEVLRGAARTGQHGDGEVLVLPLDTRLHISRLG